MPGGCFQPGKGISGDQNFQKLIADAPQDRTPEGELKAPVIADSVLFFSSPVVDQFASS